VKYEIASTGRFNKEVLRLKKRGYDIGKLDCVVDCWRTGLRCLCSIAIILWLATGRATANAISRPTGC